MGRRFAAGAAVATALVLSLAGCLGETGKSETGEGMRLTAAQALLQTSQKTGQADSFTADLSMEGTESGQSMKLRGSMRYRSKPLGYSASFTNIAMSGQSVPGGMQVILVDDALYVKMAMLSQMTGGKPWMKVLLSDIEKHSGVNVEELTRQSEQFNPETMTKMFTVSKDAKAVGEETVDGVETTHYTGTFTGKDALAALDAKQQKQVGGLLDDGGTQRLAFDLWVDDQQLPRKLVMKSVPGAAGQLTMTMIFRDYGKSVNITAPPAGQVADVGELGAGIRN